MNVLTTDEFRAFLEKAEIDVAAEKLGIGKQLSFRRYPRRTLVVHFAENEPKAYVAEVAARVVGLRQRWLLAPRYGSASTIGLVSRSADADAILFAAQEQTHLVEYLCTRPMDPDSNSMDLYVVSRDGQILVTWDHHTSSEGLGVSYAALKTRVGS